MKGSIRQRSPGSWEIQVFLGRDANGKRIRTTETVRGKKADAERRLREILTQVDKDIPPTKTRYKIGEWLDRWLEEKRAEGLREKSIDRYEVIILLHLKPAIGNIPLKKLTPMQIRDLELELTKEKPTEKGRTKKGMDRIGVQQVHNVLDAALDQAYKMELIGRNPAAQVEPPTCPRKEVFVPEKAQVQALISEAQESGHHLSAIIHLAAYTGLRRGELAGLTWKNVKLNAGYLSVVQSLVVTAHGVKMEPPKTRAGRRDVDLDLETVALLRKHRNAQRRSAKALGIEPPEMVFPNKT